jgi:hypothetical protein
LKRQAEPAAGDRFRGRFEVGPLLEQKGGNTRDDAGVVTTNDSGGGKLPHFWSRQTVQVFRAGTQLFCTLVVGITR